MVYNQNNTNDDKSYASAGVGTAALVMSIFGAAGAAGLLNGGLGNIFGGNNQNPSSSAVYQLSQKDTIIAKLESERYSDNLAREQAAEISNIKQRLAAIEVAEPLREQNLQLQIGSINATIARLTQPMVPNFNIAYPPPVPTFNVPSPIQNSGSSATTSQAA